MAPSNVGGPGSGPAHSRPPAEASAAPPARARAKAGTSAWVLGCGTVYRDAMPCAHACAREHAALTPAGLTAHKQSNCAQRPGNGSIGSAAGEEAGRTGKEAAGRCVGRAQWSGCGGQAQGGRQGKGSGRVLRLCARRACLRACTQMRWARVHAHASMCAWPHADMQRERGRERGGGEGGEGTRRRGVLKVRASAKQHAHRQRAPNNQLPHKHAHRPQTY